MNTGFCRIVTLSSEIVENRNEQERRASNRIELLIDQLRYPSKWFLYSLECVLQLTLSKNGYY